MSLPGNTFAANRTASRFSRAGSPSHSVFTTAWLHIAIVHRPWAMMPGSPTLLANASSRWIGISSPEASRYRYVWSSFTWMVNDATRASRADSGKSWLGLSGPPDSPSLTPRTNTVTYCVMTGAPSPSTLSTFTTKRVPELPMRNAYDSAVVVSSVPGTSGWWKCMSCSPCTMNINASGGITSADATSSWLHVGTTPNTGGAYFPDSYAGLSSLVAAAYAFARSGSMTAVSGSYRVPSR